MSAPRSTQSPRLSGSLVAAGSATALLVLATWIYIGYQDEVGAQLTLLGRVLALSGELQGDWYATFPAGHWAMEHFLGAVPESVRPLALLALWVATYSVFWASFIAICDSLGAPFHVGAAAGLVLIPTAANGFGSSDALLYFFYPNAPALALTLASLALLLRERHMLAGAALGLAVLVHPGVGVLAAGAAAPVVLYLVGLERRALLRLLVPFLILATPAVMQVLLDQTAGGSLSARETYDFQVLARTPHHFLYSAFPVHEYVHTGLWLAGLIAAGAILWRLRPMRAVALFAGAIIAVCIVGGIASEIGAPLILIIAQTARLSSYLVILGVAAVAAGVHRLAGAPAAIAACAVAFTASIWIADELQMDSSIDASAIEAAIMLAVLLVSAWVARRAEARPRRTLRRLRPGIAAVTGAVAAAAIVSLIVGPTPRTARATDADRALRAVSLAAREMTDPRELVLVSPGVQSVRVFAERPIVVDFYSVVLGRGDAEWNQRILDLTGNPLVLEPEPLGTDVADRIAAVNEGYQRTVARSRVPVCKYNAKVVIAAPLEPPPPWLVRVYRNEQFDLYRVRARACTEPVTG